MFKKTVDGVLAKLAKTIDELRAVEVAARDEERKQESKIQDALAVQSAAAVEAGRAARVADKIAALLQ